MRVLWLTENYPPSRGGMAQSCDRIVDGLRNRGVVVDVAHVSRSSSSTWDTSKQQNGLVLTAPLDDDPEHALHRLWTAVQLEHQRSPFSHVVAFGGAYPVHAAPIYAAWLDVPLLTLLRGNDFDAGAFSLRRRASLLHALHSSTIIGVVATSNLSRVKALVGDATVRWVPNGIDVAHWDLLPSDVEKANAWRRDQVADGRRTLGLIGQLKRKKGALFFLEALASSGAADRFHVVLVGDLEPALGHWLDLEAPRAAGLTTSRLPFLDRYELLGLLPACDLVALPSFYDGLPNVALEAAALGIPLVSSDAGGLADLVDDDIGFSFAAGDMDGCRTAVLAVAGASDDDLRRRGDAAADRVRRSYSAAAETDAYVELLHEIDRSR